MKSVEERLKWLEGDHLIAKIFLILVIVAIANLVASILKMKADQEKMKQEIRTLQTAKP